MMDCGGACWFLISTPNERFIKFDSVFLIMSVLFLFTVLLLCSLNGLVLASDVDNHDSCSYWASIGECAKNPGYMLTNCKKSCNAVDSKPVVDTSSSYESFYDIVETDIDGNEFKFDAFKGRVVYVINVASYCGYTDENYRVFRDLKKYTDQGLVIVLAPCNAFGYQEPGDGYAIKTFAKKQDFSGVILSKADVNGHDTRPAFKYLKKATNFANINWNFAGKFLVSRDGQVSLTDNNSIEQQVQALLTQPAKAQEL